MRTDKQEAFIEAFCLTGNAAKAAEMAKNAASPITDMRGTIEHRKQLVFVLTKRSLTDAITRAKGGKVDGR